MTDPGQPRKSSGPSNTTGPRNSGKLDSLLVPATIFFITQTRKHVGKCSAAIQPIPAKALT